MKTSTTGAIKQQPDSVPTHVSAWQDLEAVKNRLNNACELLSELEARIGSVLDQNVLPAGCDSCGEKSSDSALVQEARALLAKVDALCGRLSETTRRVQL